MTELSLDVQQFLDEPHLAVFVTLMKNGSPQATPVWVDHDGTHVLVNTVEGHQKDLNLRRNRNVALCIIDHARGGRYLQIRGRVIEITGGDEAADHIEKLSQKYSGRAYEGRYGERRLKLLIEPQHVSYRGGGRGNGQSGRRPG